MKKRMMVLVLAAVMAISVNPVTTFARGYIRTATTQYGLCNQDDCYITGVHKHGTVSYLGHYYGDGHDYHVSCGFEACLRLDEHEYGESCIRTSRYGNGSYGTGFQRGGCCRR